MIGEGRFIPPRDTDGEAASPACLQGFNNLGWVEFQMQKTRPGEPERAWRLTMAS